LSLVVPVVFWKVKIGRDIILDLTEIHNFQYFNVPLIVMAFTLLTLSNWVIPVLSLNIWKVFTGKNPQQNFMYEKLIYLYNGSKRMYRKPQFQIRYVAILPWSIFFYVMVRSFLPEEIEFLSLGAIVSVLLIIYIVDHIFNRPFANLIFRKIYSFSISLGFNVYKTAWFYLGLLIFSFILFLLFFTLVCFIIAQEKNFELAYFRLLIKWTIAIINLIGLAFTYLFMRFSEQLNANVFHPDLPIILSRSLHICCITISLIFTIALGVSNIYAWPAEIGFFSPILVLVIVISIYLFIADILVTSQLNLTTIYNFYGKQNKIASRYKRRVSKYYNILIYFSAIIFAYLVFFSSINSHRIRLQTVNKDIYISEDARPELIDYFKDWLNERDTVDQKLTVYLISGQGGGSRAAAWFLMAMQHLNTIDTNFTKNIFSISTVSGSSSGAAMFLADLNLNIPYNGVDVQRIKDIYGRNFISSALWGLLIGDGYEGLKSSFNQPRKTPPRDRNYYFQEEEIAAYKQSINPSLHRSADSFFRNDYLSTYHYNTKKNKFLHLNSDDSVRQKAYHLPLFFINSTIIERGERGVFAPVKLEKFSLATDLYAYFKKYISCYYQSHLYNIPMITCVNQSQAFPIINAYNYVESVGRLIDGGMYENSGTTTTLEIYEELQKYLKYSQNIRLVVLNVMNSISGEEFEPIRYRPSSIINTVTAAYTTPFGGHQSFSYKNILKKAAEEPNAAYAVPLAVEIPLTRMLPHASIDSMQYMLNKLEVNKELKKHW